MISAISQTQALPTMRTTLAKADPSALHSYSSKLKFIIEDMITIGLYPQVKNSTYFMFSPDNFEQTSLRYTEGISIRQ